MKALTLIFVLCFSAVCIADDLNTSWNQTYTDKLKQDLLKNYDKNARPHEHDSLTKCFVALTLIHIDLDETRGVLVTHAWLKMNWTDSKLSWNNASYGGQTLLHVAADEVWQPDLSLYNSAEPGIVDHFAKTHKLVYNTGWILWVPTVKFESYCPMNLKLWPFDVQKCEIKVGSWTYSGHQIDLQNDADIDTVNYYRNMEWNILDTSVERHDKYYSCCKEPYVDITYTLILQRRSLMFKAIAITPAFVIVVMTLASFWLPPQSGEKLLLNGIACIIICILLLYFSQLLPILAATPPLIVTFYSHTLYMLCVSFIISVIVINLARNRKQYALPHSIKTNILDGYIGKFFGRTQPIGGEHQSEELHDVPFEENKTADDHEIIQMTTKSKANALQNEWISLAIIIDRVVFFIYILIFIFMGFLHLC